MKWNKSLKNADALEELWCEEKWRLFESRLSQMNWSQAVKNQSLNMEIAQESPAEVSPSLDSQLKSRVSGKRQRIESTKST